MIVAKVQVSGCRCEVTCLEPIPKGIVGAVVSIEYTDSVWDNLQKTVVFRGAVTKDVLNAGNEVIIPAEAVSRAGTQLYMGVYGVDGENNVVIPTIWAALGMVQGAAAPSGDSSTDPSLPVWAQIQAMIGNLDELDTTAKGNLVAAVNEAFVSDGVPETGGADWWKDIRYFKRSEFRCPCGRCSGFPVEPQKDMVRAVDEIRQRLGVPVSIVDAGGSGVRCPEHNAEVGGVANSQHLYGLAADLHSTASPAEMKAAAEEVLGHTGGIGLYGWGIHVDTRPGYARWNG